MTVLLGYNDRFITYKIIMLVTFHYVVTVINTLMCSNNAKNIGVKL